MSYRKERKAKQQARELPKEKAREPAPPTPRLAAVSLPPRYSSAPAQYRDDTGQPAKLIEMDFTSIEQRALAYFQAELPALEAPRRKILRVPATSTLTHNAVDGESGAIIRKPRIKLTEGTDAEGRRPISFEAAKRQFTERFTMEHVPAWAMRPCARGNGFYPGPHYATDLEWYINTEFIGFNVSWSREYCRENNRSYPCGKWIGSAFTLKGNPDWDCYLWDALDRQRIAAENLKKSPTGRRKPSPTEEFVRVMAETQVDMSKIRAKGEPLPRNTLRVEKVPGGNPAKVRELREKLKKSPSVLKTRKGNTVKVEVKPSKKQPAKGKPNKRK